MDNFLTADDIEYIIENNNRAYRGNLIIMAIVDKFCYDEQTFDLLPGYREWLEEKYPGKQIHHFDSERCRQEYVGQLFSRIITGH